VILRQYGRRTKAGPMVRTAVTPAAFEAFCASLPIGSIACGPDLDQKGERLIRLEDTN